MNTLCLIVSLALGLIHFGDVTTCGGLAIKGLESGLVSKDASLQDMDNNQLEKRVKRSFDFGKVILGIGHVFADHIDHKETREKLKKVLNDKKTKDTIGGMFEAFKIFGKSFNRGVKHIPV